MTFMDGLLIGQLYYLITPMFFILLAGKVSPQFILADYYLPYEHIQTTVTIIVSMYYFPVIHWFFQSTSKNQLAKLDGRVRSILILHTILILYVISTVSVFVISGLNEGGHWFANTHEALTGSGYVLAFKHVSNFSRFAVFGLLIYFFYAGSLNRRTALILGVALVLMDFFMTFNRITAVYFFIMCLFLFARSKAAIAVMLFSLIFLVPVFSNLWPMFRSFALAEGYNITSMAKAADLAIEYASRSDVEFVDFINGAFESINIPVLNHVVRNADAYTGATDGAIYTRQLTIFLPRIVWPDKPEIFGNLLGVSINKDDTGLALNSTLLGEPFGNFGHLWPILTLPLFAFFNFVFQIITRFRPEFGGIAFFSAVAIWRFDFTIATISAIFSVVLLVFALFLPIFVDKPSDRSRPANLPLRTRSRIDYR